jgi:arylsulfatase A-like enzyme
MKKVSRSFVYGVFFAAVVAAACWWVWLRPTAPQPQIVVFMLDTVRQDAIGCYGERSGSTPHIDAVAADGVRFDRAISTSGWTMPAIASLLTGTWPTIHGSMGRGRKLTRIRDEIPMATEVLHQAGFHTVGFANAAFVSPMVGVDRGFNVFDHRYTSNSDMRRADETIDAALVELRRSRSRAGFYFIHLFDAHLDYDPPEEYAFRYTGGRRTPELPLTAAKIRPMLTGASGFGPPIPGDVAYVRGLYDAEIDFIDTQVGRFIDELKALELYDNATIVITADHGEEFWEHGLFEHGHTLYDELVHIPLIIKFPNSVPPPQSIVARQVRLLDVMPTVFDLYAVEQPPSFLGQSLLPLVRGTADVDLPAFCESTLYDTPKIALCGPRFKYIEVVSSKQDAVGELYDWRNDPGETTDLSGDLPDVRADMQTALREFVERNMAAAADLSRAKTIDLHPQRIRELRSLGYIQ